MEIASRTPEGRPNRCPVCGNEVKIEPSTPAGDAPCPHCGSLLWFSSTDGGLLLFSRLVANPLASAAEERRGDQVGAEPGWTSPIAIGDRVRIIEGTFANFEGRVDHIDPPSRRVTVLIEIYGRGTPVELDMFQVEKLPA